MSFQEEILKWYKTNKRDLPWRNTADPYKIWLSEIILQQTRVAQGLPYYEKFVSQFPTVNDLAKSSEDKVLQLWQGLGYYSRGRNLHFSAKYISTELNGEFPKTFESIIKLKGVGDYTAAAISSFAFGEKQAVLDGNVIRVLTRYFGMKDDVSLPKTIKNLRLLANELLPEQKTSDYNQGIMEFGALQCVPKSPNCNDCPLNTSCYALKNAKIKELPFKSKKVKVRERFFNYLVIIINGNFVIKKRIEKDIWQELYDFPLIESTKFLDVEDIDLQAELKKLDINSEVKSISFSNDYKHILSHQKLHVRFFKIELNQEFVSHNKSLIVVNGKSIEEFGKPILIQNYLNKYIL